MPQALELALDALFADAHLARDVVYPAEGGMPALVRAILRRPYDVTDFGQARVWSETTRLDLRLAEVPTPRSGDRIEIDGETPPTPTTAWLRHPSAIASPSGQKPAAER
jgi:hypothetical protein